MTTTIKPALMQPKLRTLLVTLSVILLSFTFNFSRAQSSTDAAVYTNLLDYAPGATVYITGSGFTPGEIVTMQVLHVGDDPDGTDPQYHQSWTTIAKLNGTIETTWLVPTDGDALGATFELTAVGQTSGQKAEVNFTDAQGGGQAEPDKIIVKSINDNSGTFCSNSPLTITFAAIGTYLPGASDLANTFNIRVTNPGGGSFDNSAAQSLPINTITELYHKDTVIGGTTYTVTYYSLGTTFPSIATGSSNYRLRIDAYNPATVGNVYKYGSNDLFQIVSPPTAVAGTAITSCYTTATAVNITTGASATNQTSILWTSSGTGSFANATSLTNATYLPSQADKDAGSVTLTLTAFGNTPCGNATSTKTLTINRTTPPTVADQSFCSASNPTVANLPTGGALYKWYTTLTGGSALSSSTALVAQTYYVSTTANSCESERTAVVVTLTGSPSVPSASAGTEATCSGFIANWSVATNATSYRLDVSTSNTFSSFVVGYNDLNVGNVSSYSVTGLADGQTYYYRIRAANTCGTTGNSSTISYSTLVAPVVTTNPTDATKCEGTSVSFTAAASGTPTPTVQWQVSTDGGATYNNVVGATSTTLTFTTSASQNGNKYQAVFTNTCNSATTTAATLSVNSLPVITMATVNINFSDALSGIKLSATDDQGPNGLTLVSVTGLPNVFTLNTGAGTVNGTKMEWPITGTANIIPGTYNVTVVVSDGTCQSSKSFDIVVAKEDLCANYNGQVAVSSVSISKNSCKASLTLSVGVQDVDGTGDVRNISVQFYINGSAIGAPVPVQSLNSTNTIGNATKMYDYQYTGTYSSLDVTYTIISNYYKVTCTDDGGETVVNVYLPQNEFITGGGYIKLGNSVGVFPGDLGRKANFGFNVKYTKSGTNLQGNINYIFRRLESDGIVHIYQVKGNAMSSLTVDANSNPRTAIFNGKCNVSDVTTGTAVPLTGTGNSTMQVIVTDAGEPGTSDEYAITVWNSSNQLWHSSNWVGTKTVKQILSGGNIQVYGSSGTPLPVSSGGITKSSNDGLLLNVDNTQSLSIQAYPNPTNNQFKLKLESSDKVQKIQLRITEVNGRVIQIFNNLTAGQVIEIGNTYRPGVYFVEMIQGSQRRQLKVVKIPD